MENIQDHINRIHVKLQQMIKYQSALETGNNQKAKEIIRLKEQNELHDIAIKKLQEQNYILKAATNSLTEADKTALEQSINKYVRDIDKCIGLLSE